MTGTTAYRPYWHGLENGERLAYPTWGMPGPAIETTFNGVRYVLANGADHLAVTVVNRRAFRHGVGRRAHARALLLLARSLEVDTYTAGLIAEWVAPDHCGIGWQSGRIRVLSESEEWAWRTDRAVRRHRAEIEAAGGVCTNWAHRNNRVCPR